MTWWETGLTIGNEWVLGDPLAPGLRHVRAVTHKDGSQGVAKGIRSFPGRPDLGRARLENEIAAMRELTGVPGVLPLLAFSTGKKAFMITPRAELLGEHFGHEPNLRDVVEAFAALADTLAVSHSRGISHRDLKPANLFWLEGRAVLGDFGLVHTVEASARLLTEPEDIVGSIYFMAPEARKPSGAHA